MALLAKMHHTTIDGFEGVSIMGKLFDFGVPAAPGPGRKTTGNPTVCPTSWSSSGVACLGG